MPVDKDILIVKYLSGNCTPAEEKMLQHWIGENNYNAHEFEQAKKMWDVSARLKKTEVQDTEAAWQEFLNIKDLPEETIEKKSWFSPIRMAAAITLFVLSGLIIYWLFPTKTSPPQFSEVKLPVANSAISKTITIYSSDSVKVFFLPDSSYVYLNKHSSLQYPENFKTGERIVNLSGEAFFEVRHTEKSFSVYCGELLTRVLGTSFNVKQDSKQNVEISVVTGKVEVTDQKQPDTKKLILQKNDKVIFHENNGSFVKTKTNHQDLKWREKSKLEKKIQKIIRKIKMKLK